MLPTTRDAYRMNLCSLHTTPECVVDGSTLTVTARADMWGYLLVEPIIFDFDGLPAGTYHLLINWQAEPAPSLTDHAKRLSYGTAVWSGSALGTVTPLAPYWFDRGGKAVASTGSGPIDASAAVAAAIASANIPGLVGTAITAADIPGTAADAAAAAITAADLPAVAAQAAQDAVDDADIAGVAASAAEDALAASTLAIPAEQAALFAIQQVQEHALTSPFAWGLGYSDAFNDAAGIDVANSTGYYVDGALKRAVLGADTATLLLNCEGDNGSTTITDAIGHSVTPTGATLSTAQKKYGTASLSLGPNKYLTVPSSADFNLAGKQWTLEADVYPTTNAAGGIFERYNAMTQNGWILWFDGARTVNFIGGGVGPTAVNLLSGAAALTLNAWNHIAVACDGTTTRLFVNGLLKDSTTGVIDDVEQDLHIGAFLAAATYFPGYMDALRITVGICRYAAAFTPPSTAPALTFDQGILRTVATPFAPHVPTRVGGVLYISDLTGITLNSDLTLEVSLDGGAHWQAITLVDQGVYSGSRHLCMADLVPATVAVGSTMLGRITATGKTVGIEGAQILIGTA